ncbi:MAG: glutamate 5-kinase, partial [Elusimicrobia bacterium]|nr:glutamate 5-kinase [Elusimicrobiota bacterium]
REALVVRSKSLLASGVKSSSGAFAPGDVVSLMEGGVEFARGLTNFGAEDLGKIRGLKTAQIEAVLGHKPADEVVHRDNMAVLEP